MKFLLAVMVSSMFTAAAMAACGTSSLKECTTKEACEKLSVPNGVQYVFTKALDKDKKPVDMCMTKESAIAADCLAVNNSKLQTGGTTAASGEGKTGTQGTGR